MNRRSLLALALTAALSLSACKQTPTLDASTPESLKRTTQLVRNELNEAGRQRYDRAVTLMVASVLDPMETLSLASRGTIPTTAGVLDRLRPSFDGLSFKEVISRGESSLAKVEARIASWKKRQAALESKYRIYSDSAQLLAGLQTTSVELTPVDPLIPGIAMNNVVLDITLRNTLEVPVTETMLMVSLLPPGSDSPWVTEQISHSFEQPLPAGGEIAFKTKSISVAVPPQATEDVALEAQVQVTRVDLVGAHPIALPSWSQHDVYELARIETALSEIEPILQSVRDDKGSL